MIDEPLKSAHWHQFGALIGILRNDVRICAVSKKQR